MTTRLPLPGNVWNEAPNAGIGALARLYWHYDTATSTWTLTGKSILESGRLADITGTGVFTLEFLAAVPPDAPSLTSTRRADGTVLTY